VQIDSILKISPSYAFSKKLANHNMLTILFLYYNFALRSSDLARDASDGSRIERPRLDGEEIAALIPKFKNRHYRRASGIRMNELPIARRRLALQNLAATSAGPKARRLALC
jgi:hypothetical protein